MTDKPYSPASDRNSQPIFEVLKDYIDIEKPATLFEIGSGTGQHASFLAQKFSNLTWQPSDAPTYHRGILSWTAEIENVKEPVEYSAGSGRPLSGFDFYFTANTLHIMSWNQVLILFHDLNKAMKSGSHLFIYGPFNVGGEYTSDSNKNFDQFLKEKNSESGLRNYEDVVSKLESRGSKLLASHQMPANNLLLVFKKD